MKFLLIAIVMNFFIGILVSILRKKPFKKILGLALSINACTTGIFLVRKIEHNWSYGQIETILFALTLYLALIIAFILCKRMNRA